MDDNSEINWLNVIYTKEFQSCLELSSLREISMVSKLMRERSKPVLFKNLKFKYNSFSIVYDMQHRKSNYGCIENTLNDITNSINGIKKYTESFYLRHNQRAGYYLYPLIKTFNNLAHLKIDTCDFSFEELTNMGKTLPNLNSFELQKVNLVKSTTDAISENDTTFPPNLSYLKLFDVYIITSTLLSDPHKYLFNKKVYPTSSRKFTLPRISIPNLKRLDIRLDNYDSSKLEEFLKINPNIESLLAHNYLNINSSFNSLKSIGINGFLNLSNINQDFMLNSLTSLVLSAANFKFYENIEILCQICPNLANLDIRFFGMASNFQPMIDNYLAPALSELQHLKTLVLIDVQIKKNCEILDFTELSKIEKLKIQLIWGSVSNIKFDKCESLKQIELSSYVDNFTDEFKNKFNNYSDWKFKFSEHTVKGYKI